MWRKIWLFAFALAVINGGLDAAHAQKQKCKASLPICLLDDLEEQIPAIKRQSWRDRAWREYAKSRAQLGETRAALEIIDRVKNPDTQAMTIRGIAMATAEAQKPVVDKKRIFDKLELSAEALEHKPSRRIAMTYIAAARAVAGTDKAAHTTARQIGNRDMRNKAYGEIAEKQAKAGRVAALRESLGKITDTTYANKQRKKTALLLAENNNPQAARELALAIENNNVLTARTLQMLVTRLLEKDVVQKDGE